MSVLGSQVFGQALMDSCGGTVKVGRQGESLKENTVKTGVFNENSMKKTCC